MAIWVNPKKKTYASTGPTAWLKRYVEYTAEALKAELRERLDKFPIRPDGEDGGAVLNDVASRTYDEEGKVTAGNEASGHHAFAAGTCTTASGANAATLGEQVIAEGENQLVHGRYNLSDMESLHIVGNGSDDANRSNAYVLDKEGNGWFAGEVTVGAEKKTLATKAWTEEALTAELKKKADITWIEELQKEIVDIQAGKPDITWIDIEVNAYATVLKGSSGYPEELDTITDDGFYGIRIYQILHGGEDGNEEIRYPLYNEYLIVSTGESGIAQMYIDADQGIRIRNGKKKSGGTITWEPWNQQFVDKTTDQDIDGRKVFHQEITVPSIGGMNPDLTITGGESLNLTANYGDVNINANNGNGNVNINGNLNSKEIQELTTRVTTLEAVNADLENIITLQQSYIGGDEA